MRWRYVVALVIAIQLPWIAGLYDFDGVHASKEVFAPEIGANGIVASRQQFVNGQPHVAIYFTGQARSLERTICSIKRHVLEPLLLIGAVLHVFVFAELKCALCREHLYDLLRTQGVRNVTFAGMQRDQIRNLSQCAMDLDEQRFRPGGGVYLMEYVSQLYYRAQVDLLRRKYEVETNTVFDTILWVRPDCVYPSTLPLPRTIIENTIYVPNFEHCTGVNDRFAMGTPQAMHRWSLLYESLCTERNARRVNVSHRCVRAVVALDGHLERDNTGPVMRQHFGCLLFVGIDFYSCLALARATPFCACRECALGSFIWLASVGCAWSCLHSKRRVYFYISW